jgi:hypothetical protein
MPSKEISAFEKEGKGDLPTITSIIISHEPPILSCVSVV